MQQDFKRIFSTDNEGNSEVILAVSYMEGEAENSLPRAYTYSLVSGTTNKDSYRADGSVWNDALDIQNNGQQQYEYKFALYEKFEDSDSRREATFMPSYRKRKVENYTYMVPMYVRIWVLSMLRGTEFMMVILFFIVYPGYIWH